MKKPKYGYCHASCCCGETALRTKEDFLWHEAQMVLDMNGHPSGDLGGEVVGMMVAFHRHMKAIEKAKIRKLGSARRAV